MVNNEPVYLNEYSNTLKSEKNIIFRGAPGTGKTYLSYQVASDIVSSDIVSNGRTDKVEELDNEERNRICFVQFHPSYDYSDFVEGLRPQIGSTNQIGFKLTDGVFKKFVLEAIENYKVGTKSQKEQEEEEKTRNKIFSFLDNVELGKEEFKIVSGNKFFIESYSEATIKINMPENAISNVLTLKINKLMDILDAGVNFNKGKEMVDHFSTRRRHEDSYYFALYNLIKGKKVTETFQQKVQSVKPYIFIIDEINRGEISKIFGELFFSIDPSYRGSKYGISTQYANMHNEEEEKFFIPHNVYIIGTMNDIDRSVDTFDFAMRRRFSFIEISAEESAKSMGLVENVQNQMKRLNEAIISIGNLSSDYQIGASYFKDLELEEVRGDSPIWNNKLKPLLKDYFRGEIKSEEKISLIEARYFKEE